MIPPKYSPFALAEKIAGRPIAPATRRFLTDSLLYSSAGFVPKLFGLVMTRITTHKLDPGDSAVLNNFIAAVALICILLSGQVETAVGRYYYEKKNDFPQFLGTVSLFTLGLSAAMTLQFWFFRDEWAGWFKFNPFVLKLALATALAQIAHQIYTQLLVVQKRSRAYLSYAIARQALFMAVAIALLTLTPPSYLCLVYAHAFMTVALAIPFLYAVVRRLRPAFQRAHLRYAFRFMAPVTLAGLAQCVLNYFDRVFISHHNLALAGQYGFAYNVAMLVLMLSGGIFNAYMPRFYEAMNEGQTGMLQRMFTRNFRLLLLAAAGLILVSKPAALLLGRPAYFGSLAIIPIVVTGYLFQYLWQCHALYLSYRRRYLMLFALSQVVLLAGLNVGLNVWLAPLCHYNVKVIALNTLIPWLVQWLLVLAIGRWLLREKMVGFQGLALPSAAYLVFATAWCFWGY